MEYEDFEDTQSDDDDDGEHFATGDAVGCAECGWHGQPDETMTAGNMMFCPDCATQVLAFG